MDHITTQAAAKILDTSPEHIARLCRRGHLAAEKFGRDWRIELASVERYLANRAAGLVKPGPKLKANDNG